VGRAQRQGLQGVAGVRLVFGADQGQRELASADAAYTQPGSARQAGCLCVRRQDGDAKDADVEMNGAAGGRLFLRSSTSPACRSDSLGEPRVLRTVPLIHFAPCMALR